MGGKGGEKRGREKGVGKWQGKKDVGEREEKGQKEKGSKKSRQKKARQKCCAELV